MMLFIVCIGVVAICALIGLVTGLYGTGFSLWLFSWLEWPILLLRGLGLNVQIGPQSGLVIVFWMNVLGFAGPAYVLYKARQWLGRAYVLALSIWTIIYLLLMIASGPMRDWP